MNCKKMFGWLKEGNLTIQENLFRIIVLIGEAAAIWILFENAMVNGLSHALFPSIIITVFFSISVYLTFVKHKVKAGSILAGLALILIAFPQSFFTTGGVESGTSIWFILGIFYTFMMFRGCTFWIFLALNIIVDGLVYLNAYLHPEKINTLCSKAAVYVDSYLSIIMVGVMVGVIMHYQLRLYEAERALAEKQRDELEKANAAQNAFFTGMSHEIRTPMNSIIGLDELILREEKNPQIRGYAENIKSASNLLLDLLNDILDISQLKQNRMDIVPMEYSPEQMFRELTQVVAVRVSEKKLAFEIDLDEDIPTTLIGDEKRIKQVVLNLLINAAKYTNEGFIGLYVEGEKKDPLTYSMKITVQDSGIGIRKEDLDNLYESFRRVDQAKNAKVEGSGLGLAITKHLVDLMGGTITVDSIYTKGSTFTITLNQTIGNAAPIGKVNLLNTELSDAEHYYEKRFEAPEARILIVDDNAMNRMVLTQLLKDTKLQIDAVESGEECLKATGQKYYNIILMDYAMPGMNGAETFSLLKKQENSLCRDIPVILLTAGDAVSAKQLVDEYGFDAYLEKPIRAELLEAEILRLLPEELIEYRSKAADLYSKASENGTIRRRKRKLCITTDCACELPEEIISQYDIKVMYLYIRTESGRFMDTREIDSDNLSYFFENEKPIARADSVTIEEYEEFFAKALSEAENVIHISLAANSGKSYGVAVEAAKCFNHVRVIDSGLISCGEGLVVLRAAQMAREGAGVDEIVEVIEQLKHSVETKFILQSVKAFCQNGYVNKFTAAIFEKLHIHPVLRMNRSYVRITGGYMGSLENAWKHFCRNLFWNRKAIDPQVVSITYVSLNVGEREFIKNEIMKRYPFEQVIMQKASFSNAVNSGPNTIGVAFYRKEKM